MIQHNLQSYDVLKKKPLTKKKTTDDEETYCVRTTNRSTEFKLQYCNGDVPEVIECDGICEFIYAPKSDIIKFVTNHTDSISNKTNICIETEYPHGLNDGDVVEVGNLQRSEDLNYFPVF